MEHLRIAYEDAQERVAASAETVAALRRTYKEAIARAKEHAPLTDALKAEFDKLPAELNDLSELHGRLRAEIAAIRDATDKVQRYDTIMRELGRLEGEITTDARKIKERKEEIVQRKVRGVGCRGCVERVCRIAVLVLLSLDCIHDLTPHTHTHPLTP